MICAHVRNEKIRLAASAFTITLGNVAIVFGGALPGKAFNAAFVR
jgi:hypothetical protein